MRKSEFRTGQTSLLGAIPSPFLFLRSWLLGINRFLLIRHVFLVGLAGLFAYAGGAKLNNLMAFHQDILNYRILNAQPAWLLAHYLPWLELFTAAGLLTPWLRRGSLTLLTSLMVFFTLALASAWFRGLDITCGCFGSSSTPAHYPTLLFRDLGLLAVLGLLLKWELRTGAVHSPAEDADQRR